MKTSRRIEVYLFSCLLAFCSLYYEYVYAQILSVCLGGTKTQYLLTISLFTCALGLGSLTFETLKIKYSTKKVFLSVELSLTILGGLGPFLVTAVLLPSETGSNLFGIFFSYGFIFTIGLLSGLEIPSLFALLRDRHGKILFFDYLGMLLASILFPFYLLPNLGTAGGSFLVATLNLFAVIWLTRVSFPKKIFMYSLNCILLTFVIFYAEELNNILSNLYLAGISE